MEFELKRKLVVRRESSCASISTQSSMDSPRSFTTDDGSQDMCRNQLEAALGDATFRQDLVASLLASPLYHKLALQVRFIGAMLDLQRNAESLRSRRVLAKKVCSVFFGDQSPFKIPNESLPIKMYRPLLRRWAWDAEPSLQRVHNAIIDQLAANPLVLDLLQTL